MPPPRPSHRAKSPAGYRAKSPAGTTVAKTVPGQLAGLCALAAKIPKVTAKALGRRGFAEAGLVTEWADVVGQDIAAICRPRGLTYPRQGRRNAGTLSLRVQSAHALQIQHMEPVLLERINRYYGYNAVARIKLQQGPLPATRQKAAAAPKPLSPAREAELTLRLSDVADPDLRTALERLGRSFHGQRG